MFFLMTHTAHRAPPIYPARALNLLNRKKTFFCFEFLFYCLHLRKSKYMSARVLTANSQNKSAITENPKKLQIAK